MSDVASVLTAVCVCGHINAKHISQTMFGYPIPSGCLVEGCECEGMVKP